MVGSRPARSSKKPTSAVVVVLPWVPAIAIPSARAVSRPSTSAWLSTGMPRARAARTSGLSWATAAVTTTRSAASTCAAAWPVYTGTPWATSASDAGPGRASQPETPWPRSRNRRASPLMPEPPIPTKWAWRTASRASGKQSAISDQSSTRRSSRPAARLTAVRVARPGAGAADRRQRPAGQRGTRRAGRRRPPAGSSQEGALGPPRHGRPQLGRLRARRGARDAEQQANGRERDDERGAAETHEGQGDAGEGDGVGDHHHVQQRLPDDKRRGTDGQQAAKAVGRAVGDDEPAPGDADEQQQHEPGAEQAQLLADHRED